MDDHAARLLRLYDEQLRTDAETPSAESVTRLGPLRLVTFPGGRGFITYRDLGGADAEGIRRLVPDALAHYVADTAISRVEWKSRGHDQAPGLHEALLDNGFVEQEPEAIMMGEAEALAVDVPLPDGVSLRQVTCETDVRAMSAMQDEAFGDPVDPKMADALLRRLARKDGMELWVAEADGHVVCAGRLEPVAGTDVAGIWGGATVPEWRGRGIYRALTSARARSALRQGKTLIHSDSTEYSRPILERAGLVKVSTTTPYHWNASEVISVETHVTIARPASEVFEFLSDQTNAPRWQKGLFEVRRLTEGPIGVGTEHAFVRRFAGRSMESRNRFTAHDPARRFVEFEIPEGSMTGKASYAVEPTGDAACRVTSRMDFTVSGPLRLATPLLARVLRRDSARDEATLKRVLEDRAGR